MIFSVENGCFDYDKKRQDDFLLQNINFSFGPGELIAVLGPNGAGKTTLLRCMMGLLPWRQGATLLDGENIRHIPYNMLWRRIAYVPQAKNPLGMFTVEELVLLGRSSHFSLLRQPSAQDKEIASDCLRRLHIQHLAGRNCRQISGGELQMALIARALAAQPEVLILDEPESNLDFKNQLVVLDAMSELAEQGIACVFNTHYPAHAMQRADKALLLDKQGRYRFGLTGEIINEDNIKEAFGVEAVIGEIETKHRVYRDILPVSVLQLDLEPPAGRHADNEEKKGEAHMEKEISEERSRETRVAIVGAIVENREAAEKINELLHEYAPYIIGRMGMPYEKKDVSIICVVVDAPEEITAALSGKLGRLSGVNIKTTYSRI
ncbi:MAG: ATP-binding cassette domain-containing protein [Firmicutes bacterium]|nr:ATP-binding cassette domain-containing protein [Bacillota bacterium]